MRVLRSFLLRQTLILLSTALICVVLMIATLYIQQVSQYMPLLSTIAGILVVAIFFTRFIISKIDSELSAEVAQLLYPGGIVLTIFLGWILSLYLKDLIPEEGIQHHVVLIAGIGVAAFLGVRCFDIKWLPSEAEIADLERGRH